MEPTVHLDHFRANGLAAATGSAGLHGVHGPEGLDAPWLRVALLCLPRRRGHNSTVLAAAAAGRQKVPGAWVAL